MGTGFGVGTGPGVGAGLDDPLEGGSDVGIGNGGGASDVMPTR